MNSNIVPPFWKTLALLFAVLNFPCMHSLASSGLKATALRCEYRTNPIAIEPTSPRLSWHVEAGENERGVTQATYQILVASRPELLRTDKADLWDSGRVDSEQSVQVVYAGKTLSSSQTCFWKV